MAAVIRVLLLVAFCARTLCAQDPGPVFKRIPAGSGLSQNTILAIIQDRRGFLWVGTAEGLNRYDGYDFVGYRHDPADSTSLSNSRVLALFEDRAGRLWAGTVNGANRFDERSGRFERVVSAGEAGAIGAVAVIVEDETGIVLHSTSLGWCRLERDEKFEQWKASEIAGILATIFFGIAATVIGIWTGKNGPAPDARLARLHSVYTSSPNSQGMYYHVNTLPDVSPVTRRHLLEKDIRDLWEQYPGILEYICKAGGEAYADWVNRGKPVPSLEFDYYYSMYLYCGPDPNRWGR
jgi:ligand-binding sensor domain-containing protein